MKDSLPIRIGISSCLLGNAVRYDGKHSRSDCILDSMGNLFEFIPFCPEVGVGMGIPRPPIQLVTFDGDIRVRGVSDTLYDATDVLTAYAQNNQDQFERLNGYIFKSRSPSCGLMDVNVYDSETNELVGTSSGQFSKTLVQQYPNLPISDDVKLLDKKMRNDFIRRVQVYAQK